jgi:hypothetical protein
VEGVEAAHQSALEREYLGIDEVNRVPVERHAAMPDDGHRVALLDQLVEVQVGCGAIVAVGFGSKRLLADEGLVAVKGPHDVVAKARQDVGQRATAEPFGVPLDDRLLRTHVRDLLGVDCLPEYDSLRVSKSSRSGVLYRR